MKYGEYKISLEMLLNNLDEVSIVIDENIINLARNAFGKMITVETEQLLNNLTKK